MMDWSYVSKVMAVGINWLCARAQIGILLVIQPALTLQKANGSRWVTTPFDLHWGFLRTIELLITNDWLYFLYLKYSDSYAIYLFEANLSSSNCYRCPTFWPYKYCVAAGKIAFVLVHSHFFPCMVFFTCTSDELIIICSSCLASLSMMGNSTQLLLKVHFNFHYQV